MDLIEPKCLRFHDCRIDGKHMRPVHQRILFAKWPVVFRELEGRRGTDADVVDETLPSRIQNSRVVAKIVGAKNSDLCA